MTWRCTNENCFPDTTCALGHLDRKECEHWKEQDGQPNEGKEPTQPATSDVPWNGYALGTSDLAILGGRGEPVVVGLIGPPDSGKTSLLAFVYMWLLKHGKLGDWDFAGSWTLGGWESVVQHCRWTGEPPPSFPPHTSSAGRHPGVLHATLRHRRFGHLRDVLFTDAPGEWFTQWARVPADATAAGARWVVEHSSVLLPLIDSDALADPARLPQVRRATRDLIERIGSTAGGSPVMVLWTKDDVEIPEAVRDGLARACEQFLPNASHWRATVKKPDSIEYCFVQAIAAASNDGRAFETVEPRLARDPFLAFRESHVGA